MKSEDPTVLHHVPYSVLHAQEPLSPDGTLGARVNRAFASLQRGVVPQ